VEKEKDSRKAMPTSSVMKTSKASLASLKSPAVSGLVAVKEFD